MFNSISNIHFYTEFDKEFDNILVGYINNPGGIPPYIEPQGFGKSGISILVKFDGKSDQEIINLMKNQMFKIKVLFETDKWYDSGTFDLSQ